MSAVSPRTLNILAAAVWYLGGIVLVLKAGSALREATVLNPGSIAPWAALLCGIAIGGLKARFLFTRVCRKNLKRIAALEHPRLWQFYRPRFYLFLAAMIGLGATLSRLAHGNYRLLIGVAVLELTIAVALLGSSIVYWKERAFHRTSA